MSSASPELNLDLLKSLIDGTSISKNINSN